MIALLLDFVIAACVIEVCLIKTIPQRSTSVLTAHYTAFALKSSRGPVPVTYQQFNQKLKKLVGACGLNPDNFSTHSFRRGGATCAFRADVPETLIQLQGDWVSDCYKRYLEMGLAEKRAVSLRLAKHITKKCPI